MINSWKNITNMEQPPKIISLEEACTLKLSFYFTGLPCPKGHVSKRSVRNRGCWECTKVYMKDYRKKHPEKTKEIDRKVYLKRKDRKAYTDKEWKLNNYSHYLWRSAKNRAKMLSIAFDLTPDDIVIPTVCPVLGFPLEKGIFKRGKNREFCPSIDRIDSTKGYVKGNVRVISYRANRWKSNMTLDDMQKILHDMKILQGETNG